MKAPLVFLAEHATAQPDGKFSIIGGHFSVVQGDRLPIQVVRLSLGVRIEFGPPEFGQNHRIEIASRGPAGLEITKPFALSFTPRRDPQDPEVTAFPFVYHMSNLVLATEGTYEFVVVGDGSPLAVGQLEARLRRPLAAPAEWDQDVTRGYEAYANGDIATSVAVFSDLAMRFPDVPEVRNNHGYLLLENGQAREALEEFTAAAKLRYVRPELLEANVACCEYSLGRFEEALERFSRAGEQRMYVGGDAFLFALNGTTLTAVHLNSGADYAALMDLNSAWSALSAGHHDSAKRHLRRVEPTDLFDRDPIIKDATEELRRQLEATPDQPVG